MDEKKKRKITEDESKIKSKKIKVENTIVEKNFVEQWQEHELLAEQQNLQLNTAKSIVKLFEDGNTIPFIARYRRDVTGSMSAEVLREVKDTYDNICCLKAKIQTVLKNIEKSGNLNPILRSTICGSRSLEELEHIYAPYKPGSKRTLAERAKELGLEEPALRLLENSCQVNLIDFVDSSNSDLKTVDLVKKGVIHIIASVIATNTDVLTFLRQLRKDVNFFIETKKTSNKTNKTVKNKENMNIVVDETKFEIYYDFKISVKTIKPHQVLAINRGEAQKVLSVKIVVPEFIFNKFLSFCTSKWINIGKFNNTRRDILSEAIEDSYTRLVQPLIIREIRSELKVQAEKASYQVFSTNLKQLLLTQPLKGRLILGIDPGYTNGCKIALISETGSILDYNVIYPHNKQSDKAAGILKNILKKHNCNLIALGNGTACRKTEEWLSNLIQNKAFRPLDVTYIIVNENGASIYSCSAEAKKEFPKLDPNIISAVSLARRVQEPLAELVKVEPKHIGVGMYQHDLKKKQLDEALDEVVSECVSFVGVDLNTASHSLLRRIAGLSDKRAVQIIEYREKNGPFTCRKQLMEVKGIGNRIFEQCIGFLRVGPINANESETFYKKSNTNRLDCTYIHPETYKIAEKLIKNFNLHIKDLGQNNFIETVKEKQLFLNLSELSKKFGTSESTIQLILDAFCKPLSYDLRSDNNQTPLFKKGLTSIDDLKCDTILTGCVNNVTHFGCFVDIGVGSNGLIHTSKLNGIKLQVGDRVEVKVLNVEMERKRISLQAIKKIE